MTIKNSKKDHLSLKKLNFFPTLEKSLFFIIRYIFSYHLIYLLIILLIFLCFLSFSFCESIDPDTDISDRTWTGFLVGNILFWGSMAGYIYFCQGLPPEILEKALEKFPSWVSDKAPSQESSSPLSDNGSSSQLTLVDKTIDKSTRGELPEFLEKHFGDSSDVDLKYLEKLTLIENPNAHPWSSYLYKYIFYDQNSDVLVVKSIPEIFFDVFPEFLEYEGHSDVSVMLNDFMCMLLEYYGKNGNIDDVALVSFQFPFIRNMSKNIETGISNISLEIQSEKKVEELFPDKIVEIPIYDDSVNMLAFISPTLYMLIVYGVLLIQFYGFYKRNVFSFVYYYLSIDLIWQKLKLKKSKRIQKNSLNEN